MAFVNPSSESCALVTELHEWLSGMIMGLKPVNEIFSMEVTLDMQCGVARINSDDRFSFGVSEEQMKAFFVLTSRWCHFADGAELVEATIDIPVDDIVRITVVMNAQEPIPEPEPEPEETESSTSETETVVEGEPNA